MQQVVSTPAQAKKLAKALKAKGYALTHIEERPMGIGVYARKSDKVIKRKLKKNPKKPDTWSGTDNKGAVYRSFRNRRQGRRRNVGRF